VLLTEVFGAFIPRFLLRHGILAPLYLVMIYDLAKSRGLLARCLSLPALKLLGNASFSIFLFQLPVQVGLKMLFQHATPPAWMPLTLAILTIVIAALISTELLEKPVSNWLRNRFGAKTNSPPGRTGSARNDSTARGYRLLRKGGQGRTATG
jgi:peptidoglycan/LPS O-acetylase OafA/YrhL